VQAYNSDTDKFKNAPSRNFYLYFYPRVSSGEIDRSVFFERMGVGISPANQMQFFRGFKNGHKGITLEHMTAAWEYYQVSPNYLFGLSADPVSMVAEPSKVYAKSISTDILKIRKMLDDLEKKIENK
jgi:hypothetical protein